MYSTQQVKGALPKRQVSSAKTSPIQVLKPESDYDLISKRDKTISYQQLFQELLSTQNPAKIQKLVANLTNQDQIQQSVQQSDIIKLVLRIYQLHLYDLTPFMHQLCDCYTEKVHRDSLRYVLLHSYEQLIGRSGNTTRLLELFYEMIALTPDFALLEEEFQIEQIGISFSRIQLRCMLLISAYDILRSLKGAVALFEDLEAFVFQQFKANMIPSQNDISTLVIAYLLLSEQLDIASRASLSKQALEIMGKSSDYSIQDLKRRFIVNASKLSSKYLGAQIFDQVNGISRKFSQQGSNQETLTYQFLIEALDMNYLVLNSESFHIDKQSTFLITQPYMFTLMEKYNKYLSRILPAKKKIDKVLSVFADEPIVKQRPNSGHKQFQIKQIKNEVASPTQGRFHGTNTKPINRPPLNQQLSSGSLHSSGKLNQFDSQEFEIIQNKLIIQQRELEELKQLYTQQTNKKPEANQTDQLRKKIELLESNLSSMKIENQSIKKEKDAKLTEVVDMKNQLQDLISKQSQLEKMLQNQSQQQQQILQQVNKQSTNTSQTMNIQIPRKTEDQKGMKRGASQFSNNSPTNDFIQMDETSPHQFKQNQSYIMQLLDMLDIGPTFAKIYTKYQSNSTDEQNQWSSDFTQVQNFRVEGQIAETKEDGKFILLKAFDQRDTQICQEQITLELLKGLVSYVDFQEMLPTNQPSINTTHQFFKFLILPYTTVVPDELTSQMKLQLWPKPYGLLNGLTLRIDFMDINCLVYLHHIEYDQFRIAICDPISFDTLRLDLEMDYSTLDQFFKDAKSIKDQYAFFSKTTLLKMTEKTPKFGDDDVAEALQDRHFEKSKVKQVTQSLQANQKFFVEAIQLKNPIEFLKYLKNITTYFESYLKQLKMTFSNSVLGQKYFKCKSWNTGTKNQLQVVQDTQTVIEVCLQNCFESFGPNKTKLKVQGRTTLPYSTIQREFSVKYESLQQEERLAIFQQLLYSFNLNIFEKACEQSEEQFDRNPIIQNSYDCGTFKRYLEYQIRIVLYDNSKISVLTISVIGANRRMCGVKFSVFSIEDSQEIGVYLPTAQGEWDMRSVDKQKIKSSVENVPFAEYLLTQIIKCPITTQILFKRILNADSKTNQINSNEIRNRKTFIERVDNFITWQEISQQTM